MSSFLTLLIFNESKKRDYYEQREENETFVKERGKRGEGRGNGFFFKMEEVDSSVETHTGVPIRSLSG